MSAYPFVSMSDKQCQRGTDDIPIPCQEIIPCQGLSLIDTCRSRESFLVGGGLLSSLGVYLKSPMSRIQARGNIRKRALVQLVKDRLYQR